MESKVIEHSAGGVVVRLNGDCPEALLIRVRKAGFELPKGHLERGESSAQAAEREIREETGLRSDQVLLQAGNKLKTLSYSFKRDDQVIHKQVDYFCYVLTDEPVLKKPKATREIRWVSKAQLHNIELESDEELRAIIEHALDLLAAGQSYV